MADIEKETPVETTPTENAEGITAPKRRGRPPKNPPKDGDPSPVDPNAEAPKKRGRPSGKKHKVNLSGDDISLIGKQVTGLHKLAAIATGIPELELSDQEGATLGQAIANVAQEYDLALDGKTGALLQLAAACGMIYVPRFLHLKKRVAQAQAKAELHVVAGTEHTPTA